MNVTSVKTRIQTPKSSFIVDYPQAREFADRQAKTFWPHFEVKVEKDRQDFLVNLTEAERHAVTTTLKLFTLYEQIIGDEFWLNFVYKKFPRPADIQAMASFFAAIELQVHGPFYSRINEELGLATDEFYNSYVNDPVLKDRIDYLHSVLNEEDDLRALGGFAFGEGAILYTNFAFLKHFQSKGKNKMVNVVSGINFSSLDEDLHSQAAAWLFRTLKEEKKAAGLIDEEYEKALKEDIIKAAHIVVEHEFRIAKKLFEKGSIQGVTEIQLNHFAQHRADKVLEYLGYEPIFKPTYNPIADYFYKGIEGFGMIDFFHSQGNAYVRGWTGEGFTF